ncbi:MAG: thioredoxin family protein [bacterium]
MRHMYIMCLTLIITIGCAPAGKHNLQSPSKEDMAVPDRHLVWAEGCYAKFAEIVSQGRKYSIPWLTLYDGAGAPVYHKNGYFVTEDGDRGVIEDWAKAFQNPKKIKAPMLERVWPYLQSLQGTGLSASSQADLPKASHYIVKYSAEWCVPCKLQSIQIAKFQKAYPELSVAYIEVEADFRAYLRLPLEKRSECNIN